MTSSERFEALLAEGESVPIAGWDFSWFEGRATEERPSWGYLRLMSERMASASAALDVQTGGGEVLARVSRPPALLLATESWPPNLEIARRNLEPLGATVIEAADDANLPFAEESFDLVVSRHPVITRWDEIARVLRPGGIYFSQQIGAGTNRELTESIIGPQSVRETQRPGQVAAAAAAAGLEVADLRHESLRVTFNDIGAVVHFLRKVIWTVPDFSVVRYRSQLRSLHDRIERDGRFVCHAERILIEARKPGRRG